ncbi:Aminotransferase class I and II [Fibrobacter sp. UWH5]|uniref:pyridoxal phosphate-dependent aminotransferase n=1 Tax=Fibrobacter sp. UWH5 TaxID=1896211 RepID=UPI000915D56C|nr:pyridoxal phosphate-dependent aminotransferase [Fibrobacter sp. UWH5]SHL22934.1 Aminotransferase class I and II [Fibrobacter sp. UWH5]
MNRLNVRLSERLPNDLTPSPFFEELEKAKKESTPFIDMTVSSPVRVGLPVELDSAVDEARKQFGHWSPDASGWREAREAVAAYYRERGGRFTANQVIITASTSEAYSVLFKTFCNPGDAILTPMPGYPLLDTLAQLEHLECAPYFLKLIREKKTGLKTVRSLRQELSAHHAARNPQTPAECHTKDPQTPAECHAEQNVAPLCHAARNPQGGVDASCLPESSAPQFRFVLDTDSLLAAPENARILLLVSPHNPTGHIVGLAEWNEIVRFCEENTLILVVDEVFGDYGFSDEVKRSWLYLRGGNRNGLGDGNINADFFDCGGNDIVFAPVNGPKCPIFWLNGLSKAVGAPQLKFGWMAFYAPRENFEEIRAALEFVEDAYLSASSCAQSLAAPLLARSADYEAQVRERLQNNWETLRAAFPGKYCPKVLGGWYAVLHLGDDDEELTLRLLREKRVLVQPGFFFDFEDDGWVVISLLQEPALFAEAVERMVEL